MEIKAIFEPNILYPIGYVFVTYDILNYKYYCGSHKSAEFDPNYFGSGSLMTQILEMYPASNFSCVPIDWAKTDKELRQKTTDWIRHYNAVNDPQWYNLVDNYKRYNCSDFCNLQQLKTKKQVKPANLSELKFPELSDYSLALKILIFLAENGSTSVNLSEISNAIDCSPEITTDLIKQFVKHHICIPLYQNKYVLNPDLLRGIRLKRTTEPQSNNTLPYDW